jgi:hypothetical protein
MRAGDPDHEQLPQGFFQGPALQPAFHNLHLTNNP